MADKWAQYAEPSTAPPPSADKWAKYAEQPAAKPGVVERFAKGVYDTTIGPVVETVQHPIKAIEGIFNVPKLEEIGKHLSSGDYGKAALAIGQYATENPAQRMATGMVQDVVTDAKEGNLAGAAGRVVGDALMLGGPKIIRGGTTKLKGAAGAVAKIAGTEAVRDAAVKASTEAVREIPGVKTAIKVKKLVDAVRGELDPKPAAAPPPVQAPAPIPAQPPNVTSTLDPMIRRSAPPIRATPQGQPIPTPAPRWENTAAMDRLRADQAAYTPAPAMQPKLLGPGPQLTEMPAAADSSFVRSVPAEYPVAEAPQPAAIPVPAEPVAPPTTASASALGEALRGLLERKQRAEQGAGVKPNAVAPQEQLQVTQPTGKTQPVIDPQASQFHANGERKSPEFRGAEKTAQNTTAKAKRFAEQMAAKGVTAEMAEQMRAGRVSDAQIGQGAPPRWGNLADFIGETEPKSSVPEIIAELRRLEAATSKESLSTETPAKSPRDMTRAELAKQAGLPENATTEQIMEALAKEMEPPKAAAAAKGRK